MTPKYQGGYPLFARMTNSLAYERELQKRDIPYYVVSGVGFFHQQEVFDCLNALRVIDNPYDDITFIGLLKSAMIGLDDNSLLYIAESISPPYLPNLTDEIFTDLSEKLEEAQLSSLRFARDMINRLTGDKDVVGIDELLQEVLSETGYEATLLTQFHGRRALGNVRMLLDLARPVTGQISLGEFIEQIDEQIIGESKYEQAPPGGAEEDAVRLITIHKAKGLEYPVVFVPDLNFSPQSVRETTLRRLDFGLVTNLRPGQEITDTDEDNDENQSPDPLSFAVSKYLEKQDQEKEALRKYYVALTRHEDYLVLVGANWRTKEGDLRSNKSFLSKLDEILNITSALEENRRELPYCDEQNDGENSDETFLATLSSRSPKPVKSTTKKSDSPGKTILRKAHSGPDIASGLEKLVTNTKGSPPLLGAIPSSLGNAELAVTGLSEFEQCPMLYHWRYELRGITDNLQCDLSSNQKSKIQNLKLSNPLTLGTLLHRCMESLDFANPQPPEILLGRAMSKMNFLETSEIEIASEIEKITEDFANMLKKFKSHELSGLLGGLEDSDIFRELDFISSCRKNAMIRGQIDLLYRAEGEYHIVDYKSNRIAGEDPAVLVVQAERYELQMLIYAAAVSRYIGKCPIDATIYFLRNGESHTFKLTPAALELSQMRIKKLSEELIHSRRTGQFRKCAQDTCQYCRNFA